MKSDKGKKAVCCMSGGVDSSVAVYLLKKQGFVVSGVFIKFFDLPSLKQSEKQAKEIAKFFKIPFFVFDFRKEFKEKIIDNFIKELKKGRTPNPCVLCNKEMKFKFLFKELKNKKIDFDFVATGHYARIKKIKNEYKVFQAKDKLKDQTYFLWALKQNQLKKVLFPIGDYPKQEIKEIAKKIKINKLASAESQEICFTNNDINNFLEKNIKQKQGLIIEQVDDKIRKTVGKHNGLWFYTIGQRKAIKLSGGPYFVLDKDVKNNVLLITKNEKKLYSKELIAQNINFITKEKIKLPMRIKAKIRYGKKAVEAEIEKYLDKKQNFVLIKFKKSQKAVTSGQSIVFYKNTELLGGGIIQ
ncbi:MAG: tRNA 2-thiouridine(34) synthase MnmA [Patescibacteria group bacterium]|nr:tRNA 2-thiouridine(34) synthase MnmA [Patescibacteria group bacterium]